MAAHKAARSARHARRRAAAGRGSAKATLVYGEPADTIMQVLGRGELSPDGDEGVRRLRMEVTPEEVGPLIRAVMRAQAELLLQEADLFEPGAPMSTGEEIQAMAVLAVALAAAEATGGTPPGP